MAGDDFLGDRRKALENEFFERQSHELLAQLRERQHEANLRKQLEEASGIRDPEILDMLASLDIAPDTLAALSLVPLVAVAWADGVCEERERNAVLSAAEKSGLKSGQASYDMLERWLAERPGHELVDAWKAYIGALSGTLDANARQKLREDLVGRARDVAEAAGGFLGLGNRISADEQTLLEELERAFG